MEGYITKFNEARREIEACFLGLPYVHISLVNSLLSRVNPQTGVVENVTYGDLADLLTVNAAPGRKDTGTPQKQTIRSYLRTIEAQCSEHFKVIREGQSLQIKFQRLPAIYASYFKYTEVYTGQDTIPYTDTPHINIDENEVFKQEENTDQYTHLYTEEYTPPINAHVKNKTLTNNKQTNTAVQSFAELKQPIPDDFYPSEALIEKALSRGLIKVVDTVEINKFILYNQASATRWAEYEPIFLAWLERDAEYKRVIKEKRQNAQPKPQRMYSRSDCNERNNNATKSSKRPTVDEVMREHRDAIGVSIDHQTINYSDSAKHFVVVAQNDCIVRPTLYQQTGCP